MISIFMLVVVFLVIAIALKVMNIGGSDMAWKAAMLMVAILAVLIILQLIFGMSIGSFNII